MSAGQAARLSRRLEDPSIPGCPACAEVGEPWIPLAELAEPARRRTSAEAIVDHLGFCPHHLAQLQTRRQPDGLEAVAADALAALAAMLDDRPRYEERLLYIMFHARGACAACSLERRRIAGAMARPEALAQQLCFPHYLAAIAKADLAQLARLATCAQRNAAALRRGLDLALGADDPALESALQWLSGASSLAPAMADFDVAPECPVCGAARAALERWFDAIATALRVGVEPRGLVPLCAAHIRMSATRGDSELAAEIACHATDAIATALARGLSENTRAERLDREQAASVFYRRRSAAYVLGLRRRMLRLPRCGACERVQLACERVQGEILDRLASRKGRTELAREGDLCLRHFAGVYMLAPHGAPRAELAARQRAALLRACDALRRGADPIGRRRALLQFGGTDG